VVLQADEVLAGFSAQLMVRGEQGDWVRSKWRCGIDDFAIHESSCFLDMMLKHVFDDLVT
jgi:hypothetical protein